MTIYAAVTGNISEPKLDFSPQNKARLTLSIAVNHSRKNRQTDQFEDIGTTWIRATLWGDYAEAAADQLTKGQRVTARGRLETREYTDREGNTGKSFEMQVDDIGTVIPKRKPGAHPQHSPAPAQSSDPWGSTGGGWATSDQQPPF